MYENDIFYAPLPELLRLKDGSEVKTAADWEKRRAEYLSEVIDIEYGGMPPKRGSGGDCGRHCGGDNR